MNCKIYRASRRDEMFVYVREGFDIEALPEDLISLVKTLSHVMDLELSPDRKLARENVTEVIANLESNGFYLQMPPDPLKTELYRGD